jgi:hypothetical protein
VNFKERDTGVRCSILYRGVFDTHSGGPMRRHDLFRDKASLLQSRENATRMKQVLVSIGRAMKERYDTAQPLPGRLAELVTKLESSTSGR